MSSYVRPAVDAPVIRDDDGRVVEFGTRWDDAPPPDDMYSVDAYSHRFAPLHTIADALIAHLRDTYDVELVDSAHIAADWVRLAPDTVRAVRVQPNDPECAALTFVFTAYPGVMLHAGLLHDFPFPICGCEACDETWETQADELEQYALAVVAGRFRETIGEGRRGEVRFTITYPGGRASGTGSADEIAADRLAQAAPVLRRLADGWAAWPRADAATT